MQFRFAMIYEQADFIGFMRAQVALASGRKKIEKLLRIISRLGGSLMILSGIGNLILSIVLKSASGGVPVSYWVISVFVILIGLMVFFSKDSRSAGKMMWRRYAKKGGKVTYLFTPSDFKLHDRDSDHRFAYSVIKDICFDDRCFYLFTSPTEGHILRRDGLAADGDFKSFIEKKTKLTAIKV